MAHFNLTGTVEPFGSATAVVAVDLSYEVRGGAFSFDEHAQGFVQDGIIRTQPGVPFSEKICVPDDVVPSFGQQAVFIVRVTAFAPVQNRQDVSFTRFFNGDSAVILQQMAAAAQGLVIGLDVTDCTPLDITAVVEGDFAELANVLAAGLYVMRGTTIPIGSVIVRRDAATKPFTGRVYCRTADLGSFPVWLLIDKAPAAPAQTAALTPLQLTRVLVRSRTTSGRAQYESESGGIAFSKVVSVTGIGTISDQLPEQIIVPLTVTRGGVGAPDWILLVRELDADFSRGELRVRGRMGLGKMWFGTPYQLLGLGRSEVRLSIQAIDRDRLPFEPAELDNPLALQVTSSSYDLFPDTDLDEIGIIDTLTFLFAIEQAIANTIAPKVRDQVASEITKALKKAVDEQFDTLAGQLAAVSDNPDQLVAEMRDTFFMHIDSVTIDVNNVTVNAVGGVRHVIVELASALDCPANAAAATHITTRPGAGRVFRHYRHALGDDRLSPWMARFRGHSPELARIVLADPWLAGELIRVAGGLQPLLRSRGGGVLSQGALAQIRGLADAAKKTASPELAHTIDEVVAVLTHGIGHDYKGLMELAVAGAEKDSGSA